MPNEVESLYKQAKLTDDWIEQWLLKRLGKGNRFEQFNHQFCKDLLADAAPIIQKARDNYCKEWLDDIFLCEFYDAPKRDELCRELWQTLKGESNE